MISPWRWLVHAVGLRSYRLWAHYQFHRFEQRTRQLQQVQRQVLLNRIAKNRDSRFGRDHSFSSIANVGDFRARVPINSYEYYEPYISRMKAGQVDAMFGPGQRLVMFAMTSGTLTARKFIPISEEFVREFRHGWMIWGVKACQHHEGMFHGAIVQLAANWDEFRTEADIPCGSVSGLVARIQRRIVRRLYCIPSEVGQIKDVMARYYTTLRMSVPRDVTYFTTANPSTSVNLARLGDAEKENLIRDIHDGTLKAQLPVPSVIREALQPRIAKPNPRRARELESIVTRTGQLLPKDYWPNLKLLGNWTGGAVSSYLRHFPSLFGATPVRDIGLLASEGRMTIPLESNCSAGVLDPTVNYYEFIPEEEIDSSMPTALEAHELEEGRNYFILLTTPSGFYRYNIFDVVRVVGKFHETPVLEFLNKGAHFASITGEKLAEAQVSRAVDRALRDLSLALTAFTLAPCWDDVLPYYTLLIERSDIGSDDQARQLLVGVDAALCRINSEYQSKRESNRLGAVRLGWLAPGAWREFCRQRLARSGGTLEQYKHPCLVNDMEFLSKMPVQGFLVVADSGSGLKGPKSTISSGSASDATVPARGSAL
jgi:GH3 auxin-responsive promoter